MNDSASYASDEIVPNRARGYTRNGVDDSPDLRDNILALPERGSSAGGGYSTAPDLLRFTKALADKKVGFVSSVTGEPVVRPIGAAGGSPAVNADLEFEPQSGDVIVVLCNLDPPSAEAIARQIRPLLRAWKD
ncbi:MAG: hypothetical protein ACRD5L_18445, partial [Bryobacteraceae bacterium]